MSKLFEKTNIAGMSVANRFVRSATWEGLATPEGAVTDRLVEAMAELARGGVGAIITGFASVVPEGRAAPWQMSVESDGMVPGLRRMADAVHQAGGRIIMQIAHAGCFAIVKEPMVVSDFPELGDKPRREMSTAYMAGLAEAFAKAAARAAEAGFDGVQIHAAHGYLLNQVLSPYYNRRTDEYGGDIAGRCRCLVEVCEAIRRAVGPDAAIWVKINGRDYAPGGQELADAVEAARRMAEVGLDAVEFSGGTLFDSGKQGPMRLGISRPEKEAYFRHDAVEFRKAVDLPLILVGGMRSPEVAEGLVDDGTADFISLSRPLICEPDLINRWHSGDRSPALCKSDNLCFGPGRKGRGIRCVVRHTE